MVEMEIKFIKCSFCSNLITLFMSTEKNEHAMIKFLNNHTKIKESSHSIGIYDSSANRVLMVCNSCSVISFKLRNPRSLLNREICGKKYQKTYSFEEEDLRIFHKELKNIIKEGTCTFIE